MTPKPTLSGVQVAACRKMSGSRQPRRRGDGLRQLHLLHAYGLRTPGRGGGHQGALQAARPLGPQILALSTYTHLLPSCETRTHKAIDDAFMEPETQETGEAQGTSVPPSKPMCPQCALAA